MDRVLGNFSYESARARYVGSDLCDLGRPCYLVAQTFPMLNDNPAVGPAKTFWIYAGCSLAGFLFVLMKMPETKGTHAGRN